jgi:hypothetical protein
MKFRISHETSAFYYGVIIPWVVFVGTLLLFVFFGFTVKDKIPTYILVGITVLCVLSELLFALLSIGEKLFGAKIIVEGDHIYVKMFMRHKKIYYDQIADVKYTHYEYYDSSSERQRHSDNLFARYRARDPRKGVRAKLIIYPEMGKPFILNDKAPGYERKRKLWTIDPNIDPDENVKLYQAYKCYCAASSNYWKIYNKLNYQ